MRHPILVALIVGACACSAGSYVWVQDMPADSFSRSFNGEYLIREGDVVNVKVFNQEPLSARARVRSDGRIAMPVIGDVEMRGKRPSALRTEIESRLSDVVVKPTVTVSVEEFQAIVVSVLGEVSKPGSYPVDPRANVAQVLATAGGLTEYASRDRIFVVRSGPQPLRVRFTYENLSRGSPRSAAFALQQGDLVVVE
jgi:polysaccharide export outer membrane protein